jgi:16S rRNA (uracil1498-N3)-methyltransferase
MQRFFVAPALLQRGQVYFTPEQSRQIAVVLRLQPGDAVAVLDNAGWLYDVTLSAVSPSATLGTVRARRLAPGEPRMKVTLYPALLKSDKLEFVLQKCTELGVSSFVPTVSDRCNVGAGISANKRERWERIIAEAAEQSERGRLPALHEVMLFPHACEQARGLSLIAWERGERRSLRDELAAHTGEGPGQRPFALNLFVGPEGGFTEAEVERARSYGIIPVSLGPRILRAETASMVGSTLLLAYTGDLE